MDFKTSFSGIFESLMTREPLFVSKEVLRHSYTPDELPHRNKEIRQLALILSSALRNEESSNILIYGKSGTGKTIVSRFVCKELERTAKKLGIPVKTAYINCEITDTQYRVLQNLAECFGENVPFTGWPTDKVYRTFVESLDREHQGVVIILDEVDRLVQKSGDDIIYNLTRMNSELKKAKVSIIGISNDLKFRDYLDARVQSSLSEESVVFKPYDARQLEDILNQRASLAFKPDVMDEYIVPLCSALAAREHGDARKALDLLRVSGEIAERESTTRITEKHVRRAKDRIEADSIVEAVRSLPTQSKVLLYSIILLEERKRRIITTGDVYDIYSSLCRKTGLDILTQRRISDLLGELDLMGIIDSTVVSKGRYGRTRQIHLVVPLVGIRIVLEDDIRLNGITNFEPPQRRLG
ncbi:cell division control protein 6 [archaeon BMS3Abin16]|nr:cell division control protein 6 [archaeon BMS3Abin16]GBE56165.1 cell division control protein 6 [archaeon BMS3Bbin16]HDY74223.1 ORC1-type DNA replication protein [Euryarchaeota archaeon]